KMGFSDGDIKSELKNTLLDLLSNNCTEQANYRVRVKLSTSAIQIFLETFENPWANKTISVLPVVTERENPEIKSSNSHASFEARRIAVEKSFDEALLIDTEGFIRECAWSNFFWFDDVGNLYGSSLLRLEGITEKILSTATKINQTQ